MCELKLSSNCFPLFSIVELGNLKQLTIGSHSFEWVKELKMANFTQLVTLIFGKGSFGSSLDGTFEMRYCGKAVKEEKSDSDQSTEKGVDENKKKAGKIVDVVKKGEVADEGLFFGDESFRHWNEFILSNCSIKRIKVGVDCFMRCEYAVFNGRLVIESND